MKIKDLLDSNDGTLPSHTWPGIYPIIYLDRDDRTLCSTCANKVLGEVAGHDVYYEGPDLPCGDCGIMIESAYGDPSEDA